MRTYPSWKNTPQRNANYKLDAVHPVERYDDAVHTGRVGADGFAVMAKAQPDRAGQRPNVAGTAMSRGPDTSFEQ